MSTMQRLRTIMTKRPSTIARPQNTTKLETTKKARTTPKWPMAITSMLPNTTKMRRKCTPTNTRKDINILGYVTGLRVKSREGARGPGRLYYFKRLRLLLRLK
jgi:hypothetical protein